MSVRSQLLSCICAAGMMACSPVTQAPSVAPPARSEPVRRAAPVRTAPLELPDSVVLFARWRKPSLLLAQFQSWSRAGVSLEQLLEQSATPSRELDLDAPIEVFVTVDASNPSGFSWALSAALTEGADPALLAEGPRDVASPLGWACAEAAALGPVRARLICAASDFDLARALDTATRALPLVSLGDADFALSLRTRALQEAQEPKLERWLSDWFSSALDVTMSSPRFDPHYRAVAESLSRELRELGRDLDGAAVEVSLAPSAEGLLLSARVPRAPGRSAFAQLAFGSGASGLAPLDFWQMHGASTEAGFLWAFEASPVGRLRPAVAELLGHVLDFRGVPDRLRRQARGLLETFPLPKAPIVHASGTFPERLGSGRPIAPWLAELGWGLYAMGGNFEEVRFYAGELVKAFDDQILGAQLGRLLRSTLGERWAPTRLKQRSPSGSGLPGRSFTLEIAFAGPRSAATETPAEAARERQPQLFVVCVPDDGGVKLAWGADEAFLISLLSRAPPNQSSTTLAHRSGLGALQETRTLAGGFASLDSLIARGPDMVAAWVGLRPPADASQILAQSPNRGLSPIVYSWSQPADAAALSLSAHVARGTIEDMLFMLASGADPGAPR